MVAETELAQDRLRAAPGLGRAAFVERGGIGAGHREVVGHARDQCVETRIGGGAVVAVGTGLGESQLQPQVAGVPGEQR